MQFNINKIWLGYNQRFEVRLLEWSGRDCTQWFCEMVPYIAEYKGKQEQTNTNTNRYYRKPCMEKESFHRKGKKVKLVLMGGLRWVRLGRCEVARAKPNNVIVSSSGQRGEAASTARAGKLVLASSSDSKLPGSPSNLACIGAGPIKYRVQCTQRTSG